MHSLNNCFRLKTPTKGMTVIELMIAVVIIGVLAAIIGSNFINSSKKRAYEAHLVSNFKILQTMLETYRVDWEQYPDNLTTLGAEASTKNYNKKAVNPYTNQQGPVGGANIWAIDFNENPVPPQLYIGRVGYYKQSPTKYYLYGYDGEGKILQRSGQNYFVSNGEVK